MSLIALCILLNSKLFIRIEMKIILNNAIVIKKITFSFCYFQNRSGHSILNRSKIKFKINRKWKWHQIIRMFSILKTILSTKIHEFGWLKIGHGYFIIAVFTCLLSLADNIWCKIDKGKFELFFILPNFILFCCYTLMRAFLVSNPSQFVSILLQMCLFYLRKH